ncbi:MAG: sugar phosphate isomerase/epimerase [Nanoarchaeota archaeon]
MGKGDYLVSEIYRGGYSSMISPSNNYMSAGSFGATTDPRSANVLQEVSTKLNMGVKQIEIEGVSAEIFDSIPKPHMKEVNRLAKLTGVEISLHGPVMDVAGFTQNGFSENDRMLAERKVRETLMRSHDLNPDGNIPVNFHSAEGIQGSQLLPPDKRTKEAGNYQKMIAVNRDTGRMAPLEVEERFLPGGEGIRKEIYTPEKSLRMLNNTEWDNSLSQIEFNRQRADEILKGMGDDPLARGLYINWAVAQQNPEAISKEALDEIRNLSPEQWNQVRNIHAAATYTDQATKSVMGVFDKAYQNCTQEEKKLLEEASKEYGKTLGAKENGKMELSKALDPKTQSDALFNLIRNLERVEPKMWIPIEEFAVEKSSQTYGNAAFDTYKKFKDKSPVLVIENPPAGFALSTGNDIRDIVVASRQQFVNNAVKEGMSENEAKKQAEKFIGATWDVGHINMLRKFGYEEKDIIKEAEAVEPYIKHVHLSDNFGFEHTELPMGMGNVPLKEIMEKLGEKGFNARKIIEASAWWQHFRSPPFQEVLEAVGSPLYSMNMAPYWNNAPGLVQGYSSGYGQMLPQINYETFGAGFSRLPTELGGTAQGAQGGRMSGRPME